MIGAGLTGTGSAGADTLLSRGGPNTLVGLGGDDLYYVSHTGDTVTETTGGGFDIGWRRRRYPAGQHRGALHDRRRLDRHRLRRRRHATEPLGGANTLVGLGGDDLYYVNNTADVVTEAANNGYER